MDRHGRKRPFWQDKRGNVAMLWAIMGGALAALIGLSIDFARAQTLRSEMQNAADGAVLVAERSANLSMAQRTAAARAYFDQTFGANQPVTGAVTFSVTELPDGGHRVVASGNFDNQMSLLAGALFGGGPGTNWRVSVQSEAQASASPPIEVALVLDNTGSMSNDMQDLRDAAQDLVEYLMSIDGDSVSVALVPFVAQVNVGSQYRNSGWIDTTGAGTLNGEMFEDRLIATRDANGSRRNRNCNFGVTTVGTSPYAITWDRSGSTCEAWSPSVVSHLALFDQLALINSNNGWKGCVEARPDLSGSDYDIDDTPASAGNPATLFVPYFWMDLEGNRSNSGNSQSYITDSDGLPSGSDFTSIGEQLSVWKYRSGITTTISTGSPDARGPNRGCPTPIVPLTTDETTVVAAVQAMRHWNGGGTNQAAGLSWGWRVLSPTAPFTEGRPYNDPSDPVKKVIVMMTDGENTNIDSFDDDVMASDYSSYSYLGQWTSSSDRPAGYRGDLPAGANRVRAGGGTIDSSNNYVDYINEREERVCQMIKDAGITIYTIQFRDTNNDNETRLRNCATDPSHFYIAADAAQLQAAFTAIGSGIGKLRLTQ